MRIIFNIHSNRVAKAAGWRAKAIQVNDKGEALLDEALKATLLADGSSIYDHIIEKGHMNDEWILIVNGITVSDESSLKRNIKDNVQMHLLSNPHAGRNVK
jgi:dihydrofolate reductase